MNVTPRPEFDPQAFQQALMRYLRRLYLPLSAPWLGRASGA